MSAPDPTRGGFITSELVSVLVPLLIKELEPILAAQGENVIRSVITQIDQLIQDKFHV